MKDDDLEALLRNVRPAGPSPELRARILAARSARPAWPWAAAAAALLLLTLALQFAASSARLHVRATVSTEVVGREDELTSTFRDSFGVKENEARLMAAVQALENEIDRRRRDQQEAQP